MAFAAGMMVFPGGRVDAADTDPRLSVRSSLSPTEAAQRLGGGAEPELAAALHVAAVRELYEEAGILLADVGPGAERAEPASLRAALLDARLTFADVAERLDLALHPERLVPIARWVTPVAYARRFDARFFAAELPIGATATFVGTEVAGHRWTTPRAALDALAAHEIEMWIPTSATLQRLVDLPSFEAIRERLAVGSIRSPSVERVAADVVRLTSWTAGGAPGRPVETLVIGRRELIVVDPGDPSPEALASILAVAREADGRIVAIALSSGDPGHAAGADELSERTGASVFGPPGSAKWLPFTVEERPEQERARPAGGPVDYRRWIGLADEP